MQSVDDRQSIYNQQQQLLFLIETTLCAFHLNIPFDEWINKFDKDEAPAREVKNIKVLFRGISKDIPT